LAFLAWKASILESSTFFVIFLESMNFHRLLHAFLLSVMLLASPAFAVDKASPLSGTTQSRSKALSPTAKTQGVQPVLLFSARQDGGRIVLGRMDGEGGNRLFLSHRRDSWVSGAPDEKGNDWAPAPSPDGKKVAFYSDRSGAANLWVMRSDGGGQEPLTEDDSAIAILSKAGEVVCAFSPDSRKLAFLKLGDVWIYDFETGLQTSLSEGGEAVGLAWAPDGKAVAFVRRNSLYLARLGNPVLKTLVANRVSWPTLAFDPKDGKRILFFQKGAWLVDVETRSATRVVTSFSKPNTLQFAPGGVSICLLSPSPEHRPEVFVSTLDGKASQVTSGGAESCFFAPDGGSLYFQRHGDLWSIKPDGTRARQLTHTPVILPVIGTMAGETR
jgi:Tol biopolymer transport system component